MSRERPWEKVTLWSPWFWTFSLDTCETIHSCCFSHQSLALGHGRRSRLVRAVPHVIPSTLTGLCARSPRPAEPESQAPDPCCWRSARLRPAAGLSISKHQGQSYYYFFHVRNIKLMKETNTFNETYVGHLEGEDLQCVRCETRRLQASVSRRSWGDRASVVNRRENNSRP